MAHREKCLRVNAQEWTETGEDAVEPVHSRSRRVVGAFVKVKKLGLRKTRPRFSTAALAAENAPSFDLVRHPDVVTPPPPVEPPHRQRREKKESQLRAPYRR